LLSPESSTATRSQADGLGPNTTAKRSSSGRTRGSTGVGAGGAVAVVAVLTGCLGVVVLVVMLTPLADG
jgi:hypothetical protein